MNARTLSFSKRSPLTAALVGVVALVCPNIAHADAEAGATETAAARALAVDGVKLAIANQCEDALDKLDRAEKLRHSPIVLRHLGECQIKLGHWVEGSESLRKLLREALPENASPAHEEAYESAAATLRELKPRIPSMKIMLSAPADADFLVKVDGNAIAHSAVGVLLPTDPGEHVIEVTARGFFTATSTVKLAPSTNETVTIQLRRDPSARPAASAVPVMGQPAASHDPKSSAQVSDSSPAKTGSQTGKTLGYVSYGVAAAGLGVGIAFGYSAMHDERELTEACPGRVCPEDTKDSLEFARTKGTISTVGFVTAGAGLALGTVFLLTSGGSSSETKAAARRPSAIAALRPRAKIGAGSITLATDF